MIYLDNHTITKPSMSALSAMMPYFKEYWGHLESPHDMGRQLIKPYENALQQINSCLGAGDAWEFRFVSSTYCAYSQLFAALFSDVLNQTGKNQLILNPLLTSIYQAAALFSSNMPTMSWDIDSIGPRTALVSTLYAEGITGVVQPIDALAKECRNHDALLHIDISYALGKAYFQIDDLPADIITFNGSLIHAPQGTGGLLFRKGLFPSFKQRSAPMPLLVALGVAAEEAQKARDLTCLETARLVMKFEEGLSCLPIQIPFKDKERLPNCSCISFPAIHNELFLYGLNRQQLFAVLGPDQTTITFALSRDTTDRDIDEAIDRCSKVYHQYGKLYGQALLKNLTSLSSTSFGDPSNLGTSETLNLKGLNFSTKPVVINWQYTRKLHQKISAPHSCGFIEENQEEREMRLFTVEKGSADNGLFAKLYWLIDLTDASVVDARYQAFGPTALIGALEGACELSIGKTYDQAGRIGSELIDSYFCDKPHEAAFPTEDAPYINFVVDLFDQIRELCQEIPLPEGYISPLPSNAEKRVIPNWLELPPPQQKALIEEIIEREIRPYIELDAGGITLLDIVKSLEVIISYQGNCTSCYSATGSTLSAIQQILRAQVHPEINVIPKT